MADVRIQMMLPEALAVEQPDGSSFADAKALTEAIVHGDEAAFNAFYQEYSARIYRMLLVVTRGNEFTSRELHQAVMIKAARKIKVFETHAQVWAWLAVVTRNEWKDLCRRRAREPMPALRDGLQAEESAGTSIGQTSEILKEALGELSEAERDLVESFYLDEVSHADFARRSGRTVKAVQCALARVRRRLRDLIEARR
jgi:RNA polymerase sigma factor (sigma-70 family)